MPSTWQFVDSIGSSPTVRLDLNTLANGIVVADDEVGMSPPEVRRVVTSSMMDHGERIPAAAYSNRVLKIPLQITSATADLAAGKLQDLARELVRPGGNILRTTIASNPMFFRTFPHPDMAYLLRLRMPTRGKVTLEIPCEPFGYGLKETLGPFTVTNDPAAAVTNPMRFDLTGVKGDIETPATFTFATGNAGYGATGRLRAAIGIRRRGTVGNTPFFLQCESLTQGSDTTVQANSASFSGSGTNWSRTTFATVPGGARRVSTATTFPTASVDARGTYRVFLRYRKTVASDVIYARLEWGDSTSVYTGGFKLLPSNTAIQYVDLGTMRIPTGTDPVFDAQTGVELAAEGTFLSVYAQRNSGTGNLDTDVLLFMPADDMLAFVDWPTLHAFSTDSFNLAGGRSPRVWCQSATNTIRSTEYIPVAGGVPYLSPNRTNRIFYIRNVGSGVGAAGADDSLTATGNVSVSYHPRYLFPLKPVST